MSDLTFNKVAGAVLATGLAIVGLRELSTGIFATEKAEKPGYLIEVAEEASGGPVAEAPIDWGTVLPTADVAGAGVRSDCWSSILRNVSARLSATLRPLSPTTSSMHTLLQFLGAGNFSVSASQPPR